MDIVIVVGPNDYDVVKKQVEYTKKNIIGYRNIYLLCYDDTLKIDGCITISEKIFPFSLDTVGEYHGKNPRNGWYLQQLLKLYAGFVIPDILDKYLVIDADTFFLKPTHFIENGKGLYNYGIEEHITYFTHMEKLHPELKKRDPSKSGICHHMLFDTKYVKELFELVELHNNDSFYKAFLKNVTDVTFAGASEYEIYFNFMLHYHANDIIIRSLNWINCGNFDNLNDNLDYASYHWYLR
jgi:hypothetical protein